MCKPTTVRQGQMYMCSLDTGSVYVYAHGKTPDEAYAAWIDKLVCRVNYAQRSSCYLQHKLDAKYHRDADLKYADSVDKPGILRRVMNYWTGQDSIG